MIKTLLGIYYCPKASRKKAINGGSNNEAHAGIIGSYN